MKLWNKYKSLLKRMKTPDSQETQKDDLCVWNQQGIFALITVMSIVGMLGFAALGIEAGRWYVTRAELSKAVDAAALVGAKNYSNPHLVTEDLMAEVGQANFTPGMLGTDGEAQISGTKESESKVQVVGSTNVLNTISRALEADASVATGYWEKTLVGSSGWAQQRETEIVLLLDQSGSMSGAMGDLKAGAQSFLDFFEETEDNDWFAFITFASGVTVDFAMGHDFYGPISDAIDNMSASGGTNTEDALDQADGPSGFSDQSNKSGDEIVQQYLIFFSDGNPTAFRGTFTRDGNDYDAVGYAADWDISLMNPDVQFQYLSVKQYETGDGLSSGSTLCQSGTPPEGYSNTKWGVLDDVEYGVNGYSEFSDVDYSDLLNTTNPEICSLAKSRGKDYVQAITKQMAIDHAQELKDTGIKIYTIGLGSIDQSFLSRIASGSGYEYYAADSEELTALFQKIAANIKLRLVK